MPKFPTKQVDILSLVKLMRAGYIAHHDDFPSVRRPKLNQARMQYIAARDAQTQAYAALGLATETKNASLAELREIMRSCLKKSEVDVSGDPEKLAYIDWGPPKIPQSIEGPGQPNNLRSISQGRGDLTLKWDKPTCGGTVRNYIIERREQPAGGEFGAWNIVGTVLNNEINLTDQPRDNQLEYRVKAVNTTGQSSPSNIAAIVL